MKTLLAFLFLSLPAVAQMNLSKGTGAINIARGTAGEAMVIGTGTGAASLTGTGGKLQVNLVDVGSGGGGTGTASSLIASGTVASGATLSNGTQHAVIRILEAGGYGPASTVSLGTNNSLAIISSGTPGLVMDNGSSNGFTIGIIGGRTHFDAYGGDPKFDFNNEVYLAGGVTINSGQTLTSGSMTLVSGTASNMVASSLTLASGTTTLLGSIVGTSNSATVSLAAGTFSNVPIRAGTAGLYDVTGAFGHAIWNTSSGAGMTLGYGGARVRSDAAFCFSVSTANGQTAHDTTISRSSAGVLQFGTTANNASGGFISSTGTVTTLTIGSGTTGALRITGDVGTGTHSGGFIIGLSSTGSAGWLYARGSAGTLTPLAPP